MTQCQKCILCKTKIVSVPVPQVLGYGGNSVHACGRLGEDHAVPKRPQALEGGPNLDRF